MSFLINLIVGTIIIATVIFLGWNFLVVTAFGFITFKITFLQSIAVVFILEVLAFFFGDH